jgi:hypothetical protein
MLAGGDRIWTPKQTVAKDGSNPTHRFVTCHHCALRASGKSFPPQHVGIYTLMLLIWRATMSIEAQNVAAGASAIRQVKKAGRYSQSDNSPVDRKAMKPTPIGSLECVSWVPQPGHQRLEWGDAIPIREEGAGAAIILIAGFLRHSIRPGIGQFALKAIIAKQYVGDAFAFS